MNADQLLVGNQQIVKTIKEYFSLILTEGKVL